MEPLLSQLEEAEQPVKNVSVCVKLHKTTALKILGLFFGEWVEPSGLPCSVLVYTRNPSLRLPVVRAIPGQFHEVFRTN